MATSPRVRSDRQLLDDWAGGDPNAGSVLIDRHFMNVESYFRNMVGEAEGIDLTQETFARLSGSLDRSASVSNVRAFLFGIARYVLYAHFEAKKKSFDPLIDSVEDIAGVTPTRVVSEVMKHSALLEAIRQLPVEKQQLLELYYWHDLSGAELGEMLGIPEGTVRTRVHNTCGQLRKTLSAPGAEDEATDLVDQIRKIREFLAIGPSVVRSSTESTTTRVEIGGQIRGDVLELSDAAGQALERLDLTVSSGGALVVLRDSPTCAFARTAGWEQGDDGLRRFFFVLSEDHSYQSLELQAQDPSDPARVVTGTLFYKLEPGGAAFDAGGLLAARPAEPVGVELARISFEADYAEFAAFVEVVNAIAEVNTALAARDLLAKDHVRVVDARMSSPLWLALGVVAGVAVPAAVRGLSPVVMSAVWRMIEALTGKLEERRAQEAELTQLMRTANGVIKEMGQGELAPEVMDKLGDMTELIVNTAGVMRRRSVSIHVGPLSVSDDKE